MATHSALVKAKRSANGYEGRIIDPQNMKVLVVDSKSSSRQLVSTLLRDCLYQVTSLKTSKEALQLLGEDSLSYDAPFDLILKEHEPPSSNACKLLRKLARNEQLCRIPVVVMSSQDDRDVVAKCLSLGATDFLVKPLRHNELRNIWTRIWWWRKATAGLYHAKQMGLSLAEDMEYETSAPSSSDSEDTKCEEEEEEPTSKEGSAPDGNGHGSNGVNGSNGSKEGNGTSRVETKVRDTGKSNNANGSSDDKNGNGNSATKDRHNGSNGNGASTTLVPERPGSCALVGTAEGKAKPFGDLDHQQPKAQAHRGGFDAYPGGPLLVAHAPSSSRKRPAYLELQGLEQESHRSRVPKHHHHHQEAVGDVAMYDPDQQSNGHTPCHVYESEQRSNGHTLPIPQDGEQQSNTPNRERDQERGSNDPAQPLCDTEQQSNGHTLLRTPYQDQDQEQRSNGHTCAPEGGQSLGQTNSSQGLLMRLFTSHVPSNTSNPEGKTSEQMVAVPGASVGSLGANRFGRADSRGGACYSGPHSAFVQYTAGSAPPPRKRSASDVVAAISGVKEGDADSDQLLRSRSNLRDRTTARTTNNASSNPSTHNTASEDTIHPVNKQSSFLPGHHSAHAGTLFGPHPPSHSMSPWVQPGAHASTLQAQAVQVAQAAAAVAAAQTSAQATHPGYPTLFPPPYGHLLPPQMLPLALYGANAGGPQGPPVRPTDPLSAFQQLNNFNKVAADHLLAAATAEAARTRGHHPGVGVDGLAGTSQLNMLVGSLLSSLWSHALNTQQMQQQVPPGPQHPLPSTLKPQPQPNGAAWGQNQMRSTFPPAYLNQNGQLQLPVSAPDSSMASGYGQSTPPTNGGANNGAGTPPVENGHLARVNAGGGFVEERHGRRALALDKYRKKRKNLKFSKIIRYESRKQLAQQRPRIKGQFVKHVMKDVPAGEGLAVAADGEVYWEEVEGGVLRKTVLPYGAEYEDEEYDQDMEDDEMDEEDEDEDMLEDDDQRTPEEKETPLEEELEVAKSLHQLREAPPRTETEVVATGAHKGPSSGGHKSEENEARGVIWPSGPAGVPGSHGEGRDFTRGLQYRGSHLRAHHSGLQTHHRPRSSHQAPPNDAHVTGCSEGPQAAQLTVSGSNHETPTGGNPTGTPKNGSDSGSSNSPEDKTRLGKHRPS